MRVTRDFPPEPWAPAAARRIVEMTAADLPRAAIDNAALLTTELVTNAIKHAHGPVRLKVGFETGRPLRVTVVDKGGGFEPQLPPEPPTDPTSGWGLYLVDHIADRWGVDPQAGEVWVEFDPSPPQPKSQGRSVGSAEAVRPHSRVRRGDTTLTG